MNGTALGWYQVPPIFQTLIQGGHCRPSNRSVDLTGTTDRPAPTQSGPHRRVHRTGIPRSKRCATDTGRARCGSLFCRSQRAPCSIEANEAARIHRGTWRRGGVAVHCARTASGRMRRIGVLMLYTENDPEGRVRATVFRQELEKLGWTVGRNLRVDYHLGSRGR
jgi:hypothetical protein